MTQLEAQYAQVQNGLATIDGQIKQAQDDLNAALSEYGSYSIADPTWAYYRAAAAAEVDRANRRKTALEDQKKQLVASAQAMQAAAGKLKTALAAAETVRYGGIQRMMELGDAENPPPPAAIDIPPKAALPVTLPQAPTLAATTAPLSPSAPSSLPLPTAVTPALIVPSGVTPDGTLVPITPVGVISTPIVPAPASGQIAPITITPPVTPSLPASPQTPTPPARRAGSAGK